MNRNRIIALIVLALGAIGPSSCERPENTQSEGATDQIATGTEEAPESTARSEDASDEDLVQSGASMAIATIESIDGAAISGEVTLEQVGDFVRITGDVTGLSDGKHGFHVHEGRSCNDRGGHFSPEDDPHGSPTEPEGSRHVGDLGNLVSEGDTARYDQVDRLVNLDGMNSVVGHVLVVHEGADEFIPQPSGSSGSEIACGVIEVATGP